MPARSAPVAGGAVAGGARAAASSSRAVVAAKPRIMQARGAPAVMFFLFAGIAIEPFSR
jgi:hypothetical protein